MNGYEISFSIIVGISAGLACGEFLRHFIGALYEFGKRLYIDRQIDCLYAANSLRHVKRELRPK